jgi:hypothetical protein
LFNNAIKVEVGGYEGKAEMSLLRLAYATSRGVSLSIGNAETCISDSTMSRWQQQQFNIAFETLEMVSMAEDEQFIIGIHRAVYAWDIINATCQALERRSSG